MSTIAEALERTGVDLSETLARSLGIVTIACTALHAVPPTSILGAILWTGYIGGAVASHMRTDSPLLAHGLFGIYLGLMVCGGLWLRDGKLREMLSLRNGRVKTERAMFETIVAILILLAVAIAVILMLAAGKPDTFSVKRAATINAPPEKIFALVSDFHRWGDWSPWEQRDSAMKRSFAGAERGKGAVYAWDGNRNVGAGRMEILEAEAPSRVLIKLDFIKPFEGHNTAEFTMLPQGGATTLSWVMKGSAPLMAKVMHVFINMDRMIGKDFEAGLANLKRLAET